jgi:nicotinamidase-related amidase
LVCVLHTLVRARAVGFRENGLARACASFDAHDWSLRVTVVASWGDDEEEG